MDNLKDRLKWLAKQNGLSMRAFEEKCGLGRGNISNMNQDGTLGSDKLTKIIDTFPGVDLYWLLTGKDDPTGLLNYQGFNDIPNSNDPQLLNKLIQQAEEIDSLKKQADKDNHISQTAKPYYDVDFIGGFSEIFNDQTIVPANNIIIKGFDKADLWCNVTGHSMEPKINHGDIIALRRCQLEDIQYGEIYAVVLDTIRTIKILRRSKDPQKLRFIPINTQDYDEQEFPMTRILHIFEVIGSVSKFF